MNEFEGAMWRKSGRSGGNDNCVEVATNLVDEVGILVRDSKDPAGPCLRFTPGEWAAFIGAVSDGDFDLHG